MYVCIHIYTHRPCRRRRACRGRAKYKLSGQAGTHRRVPVVKGMLRSP